MTRVHSLVKRQAAVAMREVSTTTAVRIVGNVVPGPVRHTPICLKRSGRSNMTNVITAAQILGTFVNLKIRLNNKIVLANCRTGFSRQALLEKIQPKLLGGIRVFERKGCERLIVKVISLVAFNEFEFEEDIRFCDCRRYNVEPIIDLFRIFAMNIHPENNCFKMIGRVDNRPKYLIVSTSATPRGSKQVMGVLRSVD